MMHKKTHMSTLTGAHTCYQIQKRTEGLPLPVPLPPPLTFLSFFGIRMKIFDLTDSKHLSQASQIVLFVIMSDDVEYTKVYPEAFTHWGVKLSGH